MEIPLKKKYRVRKPSQDGYKPPAKSGNGTKKRPNKSKASKAVKAVAKKPVEWVKGLCGDGKVRKMTREDWDVTYGNKK